MKTLVLVTTLACTLAALTPAVANHEVCTGIVVNVGDTVYIDQRGPSQTAEWWYYVETNGEAGLQRGGDAPGGYSDPCSHPNPDTLLY